MITVDSGITANEEIALARELGMKVVITDHHECHDELPEAEAVIDCKQAGTPTRSTVSRAWVWHSN